MKSHPARSAARDDDGATAVEYAVMLALILVALIGTIRSLGGSANIMWSNSQQTIDEALR